MAHKFFVVLLVLGTLVYPGFSQGAGKTPLQLPQVSPQIILPFPLPPVCIDVASAQYKDGIWLFPVTDLKAAVQRATEGETILGLILIPPDGVTTLEGKVFKGGPLFFDPCPVRRSSKLHPPVTYTGR